MELYESTRFVGSFNVSEAVPRKSLKVTEHIEVRVEGVDRVLAELVRVVGSRDTPREVLRVLQEKIELVEERDRRLKLVVRSMWRSKACRPAHARPALGCVPGKGHVVH